MIHFRSKIIYVFFGAFFFNVLAILYFSTNISATEFPAAGWHRGNVSVAQENSRKAIVSALQSASPHIEVDVIDFIDEKGHRTGLLAHDTEIEKPNGSIIKFSNYKSLKSLPHNSANPKLSPEPYITVIDLFELIRKLKKCGITPIVSLDVKEDGETGEEFGKWLGTRIKKYCFQKHVFASSFHKSNIIGIESTCPECLTGGIIFDDHWALKYLDHRYTSLDVNLIGKLTYVLGFLGKKTYPHDFVLIQDDILFAEPYLIDYWKNVRNVKFVGVFVYKKDRPYTEKEWKVLSVTDWLELDPPQMNQNFRLHHHQ